MLFGGDPLLSGDHPGLEPRQPLVTWWKDSVLDEQVAHVVGRVARRQLVKHLMGEGGVAGQLTQNRLHVGLTDPCQSTVGAVQRGEGIDDHLQLWCEHTGVGVGQKPFGGCAEYAALASSAAVKFGFVARSSRNRR